MLSTSVEALLEVNTLPPQDGGKSAYLVLIAACILQGLIPGFPYAYGVFQEYYLSSPQFPPQDSAIIAAVGTSALGIFMLTAPLIYAFLRRFSYWRKPLSSIGFLLVIAALIAGSFAGTAAHLLASQGIVYGIGSSLLFGPVLLYVDEWWHVRKGFAYGFVWLGASVSGVIVPPLMWWLLDRFGFRAALRVWAVTVFVLTVPALMCLRSRIPREQKKLHGGRIEMAFLRSKAFWVLQAGNVCVGLGYSMPLNYLPQFAKIVGMTPLMGTIALSIMNVGNIPGSIIIGKMVDKYHVTTAMNIVSIGSVLSVLLLWAFALSEPVLFVFAFTYGGFAGSFSSTWAGCADPVRKKFPATDAGMIVTMFQAGKGVGSLLSGPLSNALAEADVWCAEHARFAFGSGYGPLIAFTAVTASLGTIGWIGKKFGAV